MSLFTTPLYDYQRKVERERCACITTAWEEPRSGYSRDYEYTSDWFSMCHLLQVESPMDTMNRRISDYLKEEVYSD